MIAIFALLFRHVYFVHEQISFFSFFSRFSAAFSVFFLYFGWQVKRKGNENPAGRNANANTRRIQVAGDVDFGASFWPYFRRTGLIRSPDRGQPLYSAFLSSRI